VNYSHQYHAGNFADVMKHLALVAALTHLREDEAPFAVVDTHAGSGLYDLQSEASQKSPEFKQGIQPIINLRGQSGLLDDYLGIIRSANRETPYLRFYPGSPLMARALLRPQDRLLLCETDKQAATSLRTLFAGDRRVQVFAQDGYATLPAVILPKQKRWLVLVDPPFENRQEWDSICACVHEVYAKFPQTTFLIWYPIKDRMSVESAYEQWEKLQIPATAIELMLRPEENPLQINGTGLLLVNVPQTAQTMLEGLFSRLLQWWNCPQGRIESRTLGV